MASRGVRTTDFDYNLPEHLIAQTPVEPRDHSRLMVISRLDGTIRHDHFFHIADYLREGDLLVCNDSRVIPARLVGRRVPTGGKVEILLLRRVAEGTWETLVKPGRRLGVGVKVEISSDRSGHARSLRNAQEEEGVPALRVIAEILGRMEGGIRLVRFSNEVALEEIGRVPLPPYIHASLEEPERYQTVYALKKGSVAAPTAGLHFTPELMRKLAKKGVRLVFGTLHVGLDTFFPVHVEDPSTHPIHREYGELRSTAAVEINQAMVEGRRVIAVGTTVVRLLEAVAKMTESQKATEDEEKALSQIRPFEGWIDLLILPGYRFKVVDALITNFHLPRSTLMMLVSAFAGRDLVRRAYRVGVEEGYNFYSFGDATLIL